jgi:hypothetical protein
MNRNNFLVHIALAIVLILVAAFAGQLRRWQKEYKSRVRIIPMEEKIRQATSAAETVTVEGRVANTPEVLVKFKSGVTDRTISEITNRLNDQVEDSIESVAGLKAIDDLDDADAYQTAATYSRMPEVEYAEPNSVLTTFRPILFYQVTHDSQISGLCQMRVSVEGKQGLTSARRQRGQLQRATTT